MPATLLLADDSATMQRVIQLTFAGEDVNVVTTADGEMAKQRIDTNPPDIVLADVAIPNLDGYEIAAHIKRTPALKHIPVLLLAGAFDPIDEERKRSCGCDDVLQKPIEPQKLVGRVKELLSSQKARPAVRTIAPSQPDPSLAEAAPAAAPPFVREPVPLVPASPPALLELSDPEAIADDWEFQKGMNDLDAAFVDLDSGMELDDRARSDFANDVTNYRDGTAQWDIAAPPAQPPAFSPASPSAFAAPAPRELPARAAEADDMMPGRRGGLTRVSIAGAFSALLAAEQAVPSRPTRQAPPLSDAAVEEIVKRVLTRMTDQAVRQIVLETAERLIREEIAKIRRIQHTGIDQP